MSMFWRKTCWAIAMLWPGLMFAADPFPTGGPYVPTPQVVVDRMLQFANVGEKDFVVDLGSGDGVIVLTAARNFNAGGMGVEINPDLVKRSNDSARKFNIADRVGFVEMDVFKADLSRATVLTLYLLPGMMIDLRPKVLNELKPGTRVVSHDYHFGEWSPDDRITFDVPEKEKINGVPRATVYLWHVPARVAGTWQIKAPGESFSLTINQRFQSVDANATVGGKSVRPTVTNLQGDEFSFAMPDAKGPTRFVGRVRGDVIEGTFERAGAAKPLPWTASRTTTGRALME